MVYVHAPVSSNSENKVPQLVESVEQKLSNKRKLLMDNFSEGDQGFKKLKPVPSLHSSSLDSTGLQLETLLPQDWQQCLDIQTGKVHFYNTRSEARTSWDPKEGCSRSLELLKTRPAHMSLDLELNLPYVSPEPEPNQLRADLNNSITDDHAQSYDLLLNFGVKKQDMTENMNKITPAQSSGTTGPSWLAFEGDEKSDMVATVCKRCFMLVMLCKASPACPNCKFMHSPDQSAPYLFKRRLTQLLY